MAGEIDFEVTQTREIAGQWRKAGETVALSDRAAKYYRAPYGTGLALPKRATAAVADPLGDADS